MISPFILRLERDRRRPTPPRERKWPVLGFEDRKVAPRRGGRYAVFRICAIPSLVLTSTKNLLLLLLLLLRIEKKEEERRKQRGERKKDGKQYNHGASYPRRLTSRTHRTGRRVRQTVFARPDHLELINVGQGQAAACGRIKAPPRKLRGSNPFLFPLPLVIGRGRTPDFVSNE